MYINFALLLAFVALAHASVSPTAHISPSLIQVLKEHPTVDVILNFRQKTSTVLQQVKLDSFPSRGARIQFVADSLHSLARTSQKVVLDFLATQEVSTTSFWISNQIGVKGASAELVQQLVSFSEIESIIPDKVTLAPLPEPSLVRVAPTEQIIEWGVEKIGAPAAWAQGFTGRDVVVGILDTGVRYTHQLLRANYREERGWLDVSSEASPTPIDGGDAQGHGTHVMGTIVGTNGIGVAPEAKWIACKSAMLFTSITEYQRCAEFFLCPTHPDGTEPDCSAAPHVLSHSWGLYADENHTFMDASIQAWNAAGIFVVWANGNDGLSGCQTTRYPANTGFDLFTVGATDWTDDLAVYSSYGPGNWSGVVSPNIVAPGEFITSAHWLDDEGLRTDSGTSMAAPHVTGVIALLLTNGTEATYEEMSSFIFGGAVPLEPTGKNCGEIVETEYPNNAFGYGQISAPRAIERLLRRRQQE